MNCPICRGALVGGELVMVCTACHHGLGGGLAVNATGEFLVAPERAGTAREDGARDEARPAAARAGTDADVDDDGDGEEADGEITDVGVPSGLHAHGTVACSWCRKTAREVKKLLGRGELALCNECVALCVDILDAELGNEWRT